MIASRYLITCCLGLQQNVVWPGVGFDERILLYPLGYLAVPGTFSTEYPAQVEASNL